jgi:hypothetical protein
MVVLLPKDKLVFSDAAEQPNKDCFTGFQFIGVV